MDRRPFSCLAPSQSRIVGFSENEGRWSSVDGAQYQFSRAGRLMFKSAKWTDGDYEAGVFVRTPAWTAGLAPKYGETREQSNVAIGDTIGAIPKNR